MKKWIASHKFEIILFFCALFVRLVLFSINFSHNNHELIPTIKGDDGYYELSQNINKGNGFTYDMNPPYRPNPLRPPLWPLLIAFFTKTFGSYWAVFVFELVLACFIPILGMYVAQYIISKTLARWVGLALVFEPYSILLSFIFYTETSFTFFFLIFLLFLFRYIENQNIRNAIWMGVFLGLSCLIKPTIQYFPVIIPVVLAVFWRRRLTKAHLKHFALFVIMFSILLAPWLYRNHAEFGVWGMSAQPAFNLYAYLAPTVLAIDNHTSMATELNNFVAKDGFDANNINLSNSDFYKDKALEVIRDHKVALIKSVGITLVTFFTHDGMLTVLGYAGVTFDNIVAKPIIFLVAHPSELFGLVMHYAKSPAVLILAVRLLWYIVTVLFLIGAFVCLKRNGLKTGVVLALIIVFYFALTTSINGFGVNARFRVPVNTLIFSFAIYAFFDIKERIRSHIS